MKSEYMRACTSKLHTDESLPLSMPAVVKSGNGVTLRTVSTPKISDRLDVIIKVVTAGICRTDIYVAEGYAGSTEPLVLGHEFSGTVAAAGRGVIGLVPGTRVTVLPVLSCGLCRECISGMDYLCQNTKMLGIDIDGAFAGYIKVPARFVYPISVNVPFNEGAYSEPVWAALAILKSGIHPNMTGLIYGSNRFSELALMILKVYGFNNVSIYPSTREKSRLLTDSYDFVVETVQSTTAISEILSAVKPGGTVVIKSRHHTPVLIDFTLALKKELVFKAVNYGNFSDAVMLIEQRKICFEHLIGPVYNIEDFETAFDAAKHNESRKIFISMEQENVRNS